MTINLADNRIYKKIKNYGLVGYISKSGGIQIFNTFINDVPVEIHCVDDNYSWVLLFEDPTQNEILEFMKLDEISLEENS